MINNKKRWIVLISLMVLLVGVVVINRHVYALANKGYVTGNSVEINERGKEVSIHYVFAVDEDNGPLTSAYAILTWDASLLTLDSYTADNMIFANEGSGVLHAQLASGLVSEQASITLNFKNVLTTTATQAVVNVELKAAPGGVEMSGKDDVTLTQEQVEIVPAVITFVEKEVNVNINPKYIDVKRGSVQQFTSMVEEDTSGVHFEVSGNTSIDTKIDANGLLSVAKDETIQSNLIVKAISNKDHTKFDQASVNVIASFEDEVTQIVEDLYKADNSGLIKDETNQELIDFALENVAKLDASKSKDILIDKVEEAQKQLNNRNDEKIKKLVDDLFTNTNHEDIKASSDQIKISEVHSSLNQVHNKILKDELEIEVSKAQVMYDAIVVVKKLFKNDNEIVDTLVQEDIDKAKQITNQVVEGSLKQYLNGQIEKAQQQLNQKDIELKDSTVLKQPAKSIKSATPTIIATSRTGGNIDTKDSTNGYDYRILLGCSLIVLVSIYKSRREDDDEKEHI